MMGGACSLTQRTFALGMSHRIMLALIKEVLP